MNCESTNTIYLITCMKCLEQYVSSTIMFRNDSEFINLIWKLKKIPVGICQIDGFLWKVNEILGIVTFGDILYGCFSSAVGF